MCTFVCDCEVVSEYLLTHNLTITQIYTHIQYMYICVITQMYTHIQYVYIYVIVRLRVSRYSQLHKYSHTYSVYTFL